MDIRERETLALVAALTEFQVEIPKMETIQPIKIYPLTTVGGNPLIFPSRVLQFSKLEELQYELLRNGEKKFRLRRYKHKTV